MSAEQKNLGDSAMGDGEKTCQCCQFYGVPCRQVRATEDETTTKRNQRLFSGTKRKMPHQGQLAEDSLFLDGPSVGELQTMPKRKDPKCSRDTQVENQALHDYVDGLTITMKVIQPRGRKEPKRQATEVIPDVMLSSQGGQPSSVIQLHRKCYKCGQKGHYAKSCPQNQLSPVAPVQDLSTIPRTSGDKTHLISGDCSKQDDQNVQAQQQVIPECSDRTKHEQIKKGSKEYL